MKEDKSLKGYRINKTSCKIRFLDEPGTMALPFTCEMGTMNASATVELMIPTLKIKIIVNRVDLKNLLGDEI